ncbi:hypothetical protein HUA74_20660 [Myxococcus sp. CA051A]|uniref:Outer membrane protein beta-barrel domain-containing protein n=1 Tax=Myxococcus llanfairpwllgwyngyllgogerychwyrndrobwllllantysiliogogogochensis TaxID=2590453 RepID=A0A540X1C6_9BACT|nr:MULTISPECIES: hypothetical protein [Myxococcus]NTX01544.1 hypothetical protein [Myxococcus sp. CA040A]NTX16184.1 hypothetical protein [Myxococcus sp. CA056]NTX40099.1 hypothetical protein [Myxococcus sp. CA033]NTX63065.1 hypothetical protein [Myxococcus sp. CA051A]TQF15062.1 hypothetical protein FJV41_15420 [Myxococcus llanfairpwllgwyngyllgogerychwyrndrobwllllantysiliogogogochensis]
MRTATVKNWLTRCLVGGLLVAPPAFAQDDDDPYAYPEDEPGPSQEQIEEEEAAERRRRNVDQADEFRNASEQEGEEGDFKELAGLDDPNLGVGVELLAGALLLESPRGRFADTVLGLGVRTTWEFGRTFDLEPFRENLWADLRWTYGNSSDGTDFIRGSTSQHYFTIAPAYEFKFGKSDFGFFGQVGGGVAYQTTSITVDANETKVNGLKPLLQYGVGLRGRPRLSSSSNFRLSFRLEAMGYRRGYMNDFFLGGSVGATF